MKQFSLLHTSSDGFGAIASAVCLVHCMLTPFLFVAQANTQVLCEHGASPFWWSMIDYIFLVISLAAIHFSAKNTSLKWMPSALYTSWSLLALYILGEKFGFLHLGHGLIYIPAFSLVGLHLYNRKYCLCEDEQCCINEK